MANLLSAAAPPPQMIGIYGMAHKSGTGQWGTDCWLPAATQMSLTRIRGYTKRWRAARPLLMDDMAGQTSDCVAEDADQHGINCSGTLFNAMQQQQFMAMQRKDFPWPPIRNFCKSSVNFFLPWLTNTFSNGITIILLPGPMSFTIFPSDINVLRWVVPEKSSAWVMVDKY